MFWLIMTPDYVIRIPKPWGMGILFGTVPERLLDAFAGEKPDAFKGLAEQFVKQALPEFVPTAVQPMVEQFANRSTFTNRTIIPSTMEKWLPEYQFTPYTTETSKAVGRILGSFPGMKSRIPGQESFLSGPERAVTSPLLMENYIQAWSGGLGMYALQTVDLALRKTGALPDPVLPTKTLADIPIIKAFIVRYPTATTESIQDFHDRYNEKKSYFETWSGMAKQGNIEAMDHIQDMGGDEMFVQLDETEKALAAQQQFVQEVYRLDIPADEKRQLIDETYYGMIETARAGNEMMDEAEKDAAAAREARGR